MKRGTSIYLASAFVMVLVASDASANLDSTRGPAQNYLRGSFVSVCERVLLKKRESASTPVRAEVLEFRSRLKSVKDKAGAIQDFLKAHLDLNIKEYALVTQDLRWRSYISFGQARADLLSALSQMDQIYFEAHKAALSVREIEKFASLVRGEHQRDDFLAHYLSLHLKKSNLDMLYRILVKMGSLERRDQFILAFYHQHTTEQRVHEAGFETVRTFEYISEKDVSFLVDMVSSDSTRNHLIEEHVSQVVKRDTKVGSVISLIEKLSSDEMTNRVLRIYVSRFAKDISGTSALELAQVAPENSVREYILSTVAETRLDSDLFIGEDEIMAMAEEVSSEASDKMLLAFLRYRERSLKKSAVKLTEKEVSRIASAASSTRIQKEIRKEFGF